MHISCNSHASSFVKGDEPDEYDRRDELLNPLGLSGKYLFVYSYPLSRPAHFHHELTPDMTGEDLCVLGRTDYEAIYAAEDDPGHIPGMLNRATSDGPYGIWGHDFSDLFFEGINVDAEKKIVDFSMGS